jgi:hypothetical protein
MFPSMGGPYYSVGDIHFISGSEDIAIEASYPRDNISASDLAAALRYHNPEGDAQLYLPGPRPPQAWFDIAHVDHSQIKKSRVIIVAGAVRNT